MYDLLTVNFSSTKSFSGYGNGWYEVTYDVGGPDQETINGGSFGVTETKNIGEGSCAPTAAPQACVDKAFTIEMTTDGNPSDTAWTLQNQCTLEVVARKDYGEYLEPNNAYPPETYCIDEAEYQFIIYDGKTTVEAQFAAITEQSITQLPTSLVEHLSL